MLATTLLMSLTVSTALAQAPPQGRRRPPLPDKFTNLQVLPKDISKDDLVNTMRLFARSLGVHCDHCHEEVGETVDWASDKKEAKNAARTMMKMVHEINTNYMPKTEPLPGEKSGDKVNCWTCHRGAKEPAQGPPPEEHREGPPPGMGPNSAPPTGGGAPPPPGR
jgi:hypothetical protein